MCAGWLTRPETVLTPASQMYEARDFGAMLILADALQDAGCDAAVILDHCRGPGPHVRGCWVVDLVLDKFECRVIGRDEFQRRAEGPHFPSELLAKYENGDTILWYTGPDADGDRLIAA